MAMVQIISNVNANKIAVGIFDVRTSVEPDAYILEIILIFDSRQKSPTSLAQR